MISAPQRRRILLTTGATLFANFIALLGLTPVYPVVARDLGLGPDGFGLFLAIQGAINVLLQLPVGVVADRIGRRPVMAVGLVFMLAGQLLRWRASNAVIFGIGQIFIGLCGPFIVATAYALVADAYHTVGRAQAIGTLQVAINLGQGVGFLLAGLVTPYLGWRGFSLLVAGLPLALLPLLHRMPEPRLHRPAGSLRSGMGAALVFLAHPRSAAMTVVVTCSIAAAMGATYLLPFLARLHGISGEGTGLLLLPFLVGAILGSVPAGRSADRIGVRIPTLVALGAAVIAITVFAILGFSPASVAACYFVIGAAISATAGLVASAVVDVAGQHGQGTGAALGGMRIGLGLGAAGAPPLIGLVFVRTGSSAAFFTLAAVALAAGVVFTLASRTPGVGEPARIALKPQEGS